MRLAAAHMLLTQRDNDAALHQLKKIDINQPDDRRLVLVLSDRASLGDVDGAMRDLERSRVRLQPAFENYTLARIAWTRGDAAGAIRAYDQCAIHASADSLTGMETDARLYQAMASIRLRDYPNALRALGLCAARARQLGQKQREYETNAIAAYVAHQQSDFAERDRRFAQAAAIVVHDGDAAQLRILAIRLHSNVWKTWKRPLITGDPVLTGVDALIDAREEWSQGHADAARAALRRARAEAVDATGFREEAELLAAELGEPSKVLRPDPPYPNILRYLAIFDQEKT